VAIHDFVADALHGDRAERRFERGFQITVSPQTIARSAFQLHTATGKLKALMMPTTPSGCHCFEHAMAGALAVHRQSVELAREADGEIGDVDHFLNFAESFGEDLAGLESHEAAEFVLVAAERVAELARDFAALGSGKKPPALESFRGESNGLLVIVGCREGTRPSSRPSIGE